MDREPNGLGHERQQDVFGEVIEQPRLPPHEEVRAVARRNMLLDVERGMSRMLSPFRGSSRCIDRPATGSTQSTTDRAYSTGSGSFTGYSDHERQSLEAGYGAARMEIRGAASHGFKKRQC